ncbi:histidine kinase [Aquimarina gracilis]|uniref:Histidine kinase n=1 Tax=Aquimarina gracilis TaxID=874422 RepID=A0ABU5ZPY6_9FLAO|nr:histidine kinase [Aquimarina gracilis]MEB3344156.1 histidine kinase [Aquimarina gracilis]
MYLKKEWKYHLILALILIGLDFFKILNSDEFKLLKNLDAMYLCLKSTFFISSIAVYFINFKIVCPRFLKKSYLSWFIISSLGLVLIFAAIRYTLEEVIVFEITGQHNYFEETRRFWYYVIDNSYFALPPILYSTMVYLVLKLIEDKDLNKAELDLLKSQISPHFLFNTLNAFYVELIDDKPKVAKDVHKLSELLRYVTYDSKQDFVPLQREIDFLNDYMHFFNKRFEEELSLDFSIDGSIQNQQIPSLVLIHFVENLFKHGVVNDKKNPAKINITITNDKLELETSNAILSSEKYMDSGIGTQNVKRRLTAIFNTNYDLNYSTKGNNFYTYLKIPI